MKKELRDAWVKALRSGNYKQGFGLLRSQQNEFCCLGVLADVGGCKWTPGVSVYDDCYDVVFGDDARSSLLPARLADRFGISGEQSHLWKMNDNGGSFPEIADWIEANIPAE